MGATYKILINWTGRKNKSDLYSLHLRVTLNRKALYLNTGIKIKLNEFFGKDKKWIKETHPLNYELNHMIAAKVDALAAYETKRRAFGHPVSLDDLRQHWERGSDKNIFNDYVDTYIKKNKFGSHLTFLKYKTFQNLINEYRQGIPFNSLNEKFFNDFAGWLQNTKHQAAQTARKYFEVLRKVTREAIKEGYLGYDPFHGLEIAFNSDKKREFVVLDIQEIMKIQNVELAELHMQRTREHFMFCFYSGFYYSDLCGLRWEDIKEDPQHGIYISKGRHKTGVDYVAPIGLFDYAVRILDKQKKLESEFVFPDAIDLHVHNRQLKQLAKLAGIAKTITNKTARRSFIQWMQSQGMEPVFAQRMAGHTKFSTTEQYFKLGIRDIATRIKEKINLDDVNG